MLASPTARDQHDRDRIVATLHALDADLYRTALLGADGIRTRLRLGRWRVVTDAVAATVGVGADHPEAVHLRRGRWMVVTQALWAARLPDWPTGHPAARATRS
jgi:hypothetical protein